MDKHLEQRFVEFVRANKNNVYLLAYSYVKNEQDALDIVQDSIQKGWLAIEKLRSSEQLKSWFYQIVVRTAIDFLRKHKRVSYMEHDVLEAVSSPKEDVYENLDLKEALDHLPVQFREVVILRYFEDMKLEDVAYVLNIPLSTTKSRLYKALALLKIELLEEDDSVGQTDERFKKTI